MVRSSFKSHNSSKVRQKAVQPLTALSLSSFCLNGATFRGISGQAHVDNVKKIPIIDTCIVLEEQFDT